MRIEYDDRVYEETSRKKIINVGVTINNKKTSEFLEMFPKSRLVQGAVTFDTLSVPLSCEFELDDLTSFVECLGGIVTSCEGHIVSKGQITHKGTGILIGEW